MTISFFGHFGSLNSGNESTFIAVLSKLRSTYPHSNFLCICTNPRVIIEREGIEAVPITTTPSKLWDIRVRVDKRIKRFAVGVIEEAWGYSRAFRTLKGSALLIIPGTGLLTDAYGLADWGPYNLFKWSLIARMRGCNVVFMSVGAGPIYTPLGRFLIKSSLRLSNFRSYRDESSMNYLKHIGFHEKEDRVYPDLVFGLPSSLFPVKKPVGKRRVVGLGLMTYAGRYSVANPSDRTYRGYLCSLASLVEWLLAQNYDVRLLLGDEDTEAISEFKSVLREQLGAYDETRIVNEPITSVEQVLAQIAATDVVVATRFHNVLLSLLLNKPVIAISFHHKCDSLMRDMELSAYCHDIDELDAEALIQQFQELERNHDKLKQMIAVKVHEARSRLDEQYDVLFGGSG